MSTLTNVYVFSKDRAADYVPTDESSNRKAHARHNGELQGFLQILDSLLTALALE